MSKTEKVSTQQEDNELPEDVLQIMEAHRRLKLLSKALPVDAEQSVGFRTMFADSLIALHFKELDSKK